MILQNPAVKTSFEQKKINNSLFFGLQIVKMMLYYMETLQGTLKFLIKVGVWLSLVRALRSGRKSRRFESSHPDHFFALIPRQKNMKPSGFASCTDLSHHSFSNGGRCASYILMLDEQSSQAQNVLHTFVCLTRRRRARHKVLHKTPFQTWHGVARRAKTAEAFAFPNMKQLPSSFHYAATSR